MNILLLFVGIFLPIIYLIRNILDRREIVTLSISIFLIIESLSISNLERISPLLVLVGSSIYLVYKDKFTLKSINIIFVATFNYSILYFSLYAIKKGVTLNEMVLLGSVNFLITIIFVEGNELLEEKVRFLGKYAIGILLAIYDLYIGLGYIGIFFFITYIKECKKNNIQKKEIEGLREYTKTLEKLNSEVRGFRHDYMNILIAMNEYFKEDNLDKARKFFKDNIWQLEKEISLDDLRLGLLGKIKNPEIKSILINKILNAKAAKVKVFIDIDCEVDYINMRKGDFIRVIGIFIDNAIEGSANSEERQVLIGIFKEKDSLNVIIENSIENKEMSINEIMRDGFSSKGKDRGIGLYTVNNILGKNENVILDTMINKGKFMQHLIIY